MYCLTGNDREFRREGQVSLRWSHLTNGRQHGRNHRVADQDVDAKLQGESRSLGGWNGEDPSFDQGAFVFLFHADKQNFLWVSILLMMLDDVLQDYKEYHTDTTVHFVISLSEFGKQSIDKDGLEKTFKVTSSVSISNMVCFDAEGKIKKYTTPEEILLDFYDVRMEHYHKRKVSNCFSELFVAVVKVH